VTTTKASDAVLERLTRLHPKSIDLVLDRVWRLLGKVGNPQESLPPVVHVAGTNGKGSTIAMMRAMLEAAGYSVHVYTSPHLVRFNERIRLAGELIGEDELTALLEECEAANGSDQITYFEITTVAAYLAFARHKADILLLETGLGGRLDATNVIARPALTVITPVSIDHVQFLGDTIQKIASEKAGIIKQGVTCISGPQDTRALAVLQVRADECSAPLFTARRDWLVTEGEGGFDLRSTDRQTRHYPNPNLPGHHQVMNAATALVALDNLPGFTVPPAARETGLRNVDWPARMQRLTRGPLVDLLPPEVELWLDGGHNPGAGVVLADALRDWDGKPVHAVCGMINTKASDGFLAPLAGLFAGLKAVAIPGEPNSLSAADTAAAAASVGIAADEAASVEEAVRELAAKIDGPARILICGSLYLAGVVLAGNG
jgi:dihydrofolate synthase/folylpolyglutamate synthase